MSDGEAILKSIIAFPADDTPRLMYADWLQENGEEDRAEFIRLMIADPKFMIEHNPAVSGYSSRSRDRVGLLLHRNPQWLGEYDGSDGRSWVWRRGFVEVIGDTADSWLSRGDGIAAQHPIREVFLASLPTTELLLAEFNRREPLPILDPLEDLNIDTSGAEVSALFRVWWPGIVFHMPPPTLEFAITRTLTDVTMGQMRGIQEAIGAVNSRPFAGYPAGYLRLLRVDGEDVTFFAEDDIVPRRFGLVRRVQNPSFHVVFTFGLSIIIGVHRRVDFNTIIPPS